MDDNAKPLISGSTPKKGLAKVKEDLVVLKNMYGRRFYDPARAYMLLIVAQIHQPCVTMYLERCVYMHALITHRWFKRIDGGTHAERLDNFYRGQAKQCTCG